MEERGHERDRKLAAPGTAALPSRGHSSTSSAASTTTARAMTM